MKVAIVSKRRRVEQSIPRRARVVRTVPAKSVRLRAVASLATIAVASLFRVCRGCRKRPRFLSGAVHHAASRDTCSILRRQAAALSSLISLRRPTSIVAGAKPAFIKL
jgi:hypothetical protein